MPYIVMDEDKEITEMLEVFKKKMNITDDNEALEILLKQGMILTGYEFKDDDYIKVHSVN